MKAIKTLIPFPKKEQGFSNAPSTFIMLINQVFRYYIGKFMVVTSMIFSSIASSKKSTKTI